MVINFYGIKEVKMVLGSCNIIKDKDSLVYGVLYNIPKKEKSLLDKVEGLGYGYSEILAEIYINDKDCCRNSLVKAVTYCATDIDETLLPYDWYKNFVLTGAIENNFPEKYIDDIRRQESIKT